MKEKAEYSFIEIINEYSVFMIARFFVNIL